MSTFATLAGLALIAIGQTATLEQRLLNEAPGALASEVATLGDASRGALVYYRRALLCVACHEGEPGVAPLGPDLAAKRTATTENLIDSILQPSKIITRGYDGVIVSMKSGRVESGLIAEETTTELVLRNATNQRQGLHIKTVDIDERAPSPQSLMPAGLVNSIESRGAFLDLVRYLRELADFGPARARELKPDPAILAAPALPAYESDLNHAALIANWGPESLKRGELVYHRVCANCHGTKEHAGSLPAAPRFATGQFKNGADPYRMYRTVTDGFGQMPPHTWLVPIQRYDAIHFIRESLLRENNPTQYVAIDQRYLSSLPKGTQLGPPAPSSEPWSAMDYGPFLMATIEAGEDGKNIAHKGIAIRLDKGPGGVAKGRSWVLYEHDTMRLAAAWQGDGFIDWEGINFTGSHQVHPRAVGRIEFANAGAMGWADPRTGSFDDQRIIGRDGRRYGPAPREVARFIGVYVHNDDVILSYRIGGVSVLESPSLERAPDGDKPMIVARTLEIGPTKSELKVRVAPAGISAVVVGGLGCSVKQVDGGMILVVEEADEARRVKVLTSAMGASELQNYAARVPKPALLTPRTKGGERRWASEITTSVQSMQGEGAFAIDVLPLPVRNPWNCQIRVTGFDFLDDDRAAVCTWDGDVWLASGLASTSGALTWRRVAAGLFQPLGLLVRGGEILVSCRDQIVRLRDVNRDGETDFYETFNSDHQVTEHFHEFAMGLQSDRDGNLYYAKAARHGLEAVVPQHGTLLRVSADGSRTDILATGFRAPNGVCLNPDGTFFLSDQEGFWTPKNRINLVKEGGFYGNMWSYTNVKDTSDSAMEQPVCWITNSFDRSPAELLWVPEKAWGPLAGSLLNLSYGQGKIFVVLRENAGGQTQGGMVALPIPAFPTGLVRGRFHPATGDLYVGGLFAWAGNQTQPGGFYRIRYRDRPTYVPVRISAEPRRLTFVFSDPLDRASVEDSARFSAKAWGLRRTVNYGSPHVNERPLRIETASLSANGRVVTLTLPELSPTAGIEVTYLLRGRNGEPVDGVFHGTLHRLESRPSAAGSSLDGPQRDGGKPE